MPSLAMIGGTSFSGMLLTPASVSLPKIRSLVVGERACADLSTLFSERRLRPSRAASIGYQPAAWSVRWSPVVAALEWRHEH
jgi:hypothetical protein